MRTTSRVLASLCIAMSIVLAGLAGPIALSADASTRSAEVMQVVAKQKGKPYKYGAAGPKAFDCSGLVQYVYKKAGKKIGRTSGAQLGGKHIAKGKKQKGDIMIFINSSGAYHSAIYAGGGKMWEAQRSGTRVGVHKIWSSGYVVRRP
jgi:cell wall-associated NlpC family hydrolase